MQNNIRVHFPRGVSGSFLINCILYYVHPEYFLNLSLGPEGDAHPQPYDLSDIGRSKVFNFTNHSYFVENTSNSETKLNDNFTTVFIKCDMQDYSVIADMFLNKVLVSKIDLQEYNTMKGADWAKFEEWTTCDFLLFAFLPQPLANRSHGHALNPSFQSKYFFISKSCFHG